MSQSQLSVTAPDNDRPILDQAKKKSLIALVGGGVSAALSFGLISPELADQINSGWAYVIGAIMTIIPLATSLLHALGIVKGSEKRTTPVDSPTDADGTPLVPLHAAGLDEPEPDVDDTSGVPVSAPELDMLEPELEVRGPTSVDNVTVPELDASTGRHSQPVVSTEDTGYIPAVP